MDSTQKRYLMCRPTYFKVSYSINPWMNLQKAVKLDLAMQQWNNLKTTMEQCGAVVDVMEPNGANNYPDIVFTANAAIMRGKKAYVANFRYPERKGESSFYEKWFRDNGYETVGNPDIICEGAGDAVWLGNDKRLLFVGVGPRTEDRALRDVAEKLADGTTFKVFGCRLVDPRFYHLDVCLTILDESNGFYFPGAFDPITQHNMNNELNLIPVTEQEASNFACNAVIIGKTVIMGEGNDSMREKLGKLGYETKFVDMSEFLKSGGSARCCTLEI